MLIIKPFFKFRQRLNHADSNGPGHAKTCLMSYANNKGADQPFAFAQSGASDQHLCCSLLK